MRPALLIILSCVSASAQERFDVLVYGATPAGIAASISAAREGASVVLLEETSHIGGLTSGGMSNTDFRSFEAVQGWYREYMNRVVAYYSETYGAGSPQVKGAAHGAWAEPKVTRLLFERMLAEQKSLKLFTRHRLLKVHSAAAGNGRTRPVAADFLDLASNQQRSIQATQFIDATYEGDLLDLAGARYTLGREPRSQYGELLAGIVYFSSDRKILPGSTGEGDSRIQCYNFRVCMTDDPANRVPVPKPAGYSRDEFVPLLNVLKSGQVKTVNEGLVRFRYVQNRKADVNDLMGSPFSLRLLEENDEWPKGSPETRARIFERFKTYTLGFFWFLQNDPEVPAHIRNELAPWGLPRDEFTDTGHFPPVLYVREARRLVGDWVFTEKDTQPAPGSVRAPVHPDSVAVGDYTLDSHGVAKPDGYHLDMPEGKFAFPVVPYQIPYRVLLPSNVENLLVPVCMSASHVGFNALRMEPQWAALGQAAGIAAGMAVREGTAPRELRVPDLQRRLWSLKAITVYTADVMPESPEFEAVQYWGTRGLFADLVDRKQSPYQTPESLKMGQWAKAWPYHAVDLDKPMDAALAARWLNRAGLKPGLAFERARTRGEFLRLMLEKAPAADR